MGFLDWFRSSAPAAESTAVSAPRAEAVYFDLLDPALLAYMMADQPSDSGIYISTEKALRNPAVLRAVSLISSGIGMLPLHLIEKATKNKADAVPLFRVLHRKPNPWQTAYEYRQLQQLRLLTEGNAYARIVRSFDLRTRKDKVVSLIPMDPRQTMVVQNPDWTLSYRYQPPTGGPEERIAGRDVHHVRGLTTDGIRGMSMVRQAADAIGLAIAAELALSRLYRRGSFVNGVLETDKRMSRPAMESLKAQWSSLYEGAANAGGTPVLEEGVKYKGIGPNARDAQSNETRARQIEEIARIFGVPRPLMMVDDTSWGSGIEALGQLFVQYGLNPWFEAWEQAIVRDLLDDADADRYEAKFNAGALLRGSLKDQAEFFSKALGAGGQRPFMSQNEVRDVMDMPRSADPGANDLTNPMTQPTQTGAAGGEGTALEGANENVA